MKGLEVDGVRQDLKVLDHAYRNRKAAASNTNKSKYDRRFTTN